MFLFHKHNCIHKGIVLEDWHGTMTGCYSLKHQPPPQMARIDLGSKNKKILNLSLRVLNALVAVLLYLNSLGVSSCQSLQFLDAMRLRPWWDYFSSSSVLHLWCIPGKKKQTVDKICTFPCFTYGWWCRSFVRTNGYASRHRLLRRS